MKQFNQVSIEEGARVELHDALALTGAEVSVNTLPANAFVPFIHAHKQNEEIYVILEGQGKIIIDEEAVAVKKGDWLRIAPAAKRQIFASDVTALSFACIQVKANSLEGYTMEDAIV